MAKTKGSSKEKEVKGSNGNRERSAGDGWEKVTADRTPWLVKHPDLSITGYLLGRFSFGSGKNKRYYFQVKLTCDDVEAVTGKGEDQEKVILNKGDTISVGESFALERDLAPLSDDGGKYEIRITYGEPERDREGKAKFWPVTTEKKTLRAATRRPNIEESRDNRDDRNPENADDSEIPF